MAFVPAATPISLHNSTRFAYTQPGLLNRRRPPPRATLAERVVSPASMPQTVASPSQPSTGPVTIIDTEADLLASLARSANQLVVIRVHARWCRSCRALEPKWRRLAREFEHIHFAELEFEAHRLLAARLAVKVMPTFLIYDAERNKVDHFSCGPRRANVLRERIELAIDNRQRRIDGRPLLEVPDSAPPPPNVV